MKTAEHARDARYTAAAGPMILTGTQALIRLLITQRRRDRASGLNTAGFLSGYRGSPLGGLDIQAFAAKKALEAEDIVFKPGLNEDLAMTAVWGSQMTPLFPGHTADGVFAMWYGKGPGVDRSGDAMKHANYAGTTRLGGVLVVTGDDHAAKSSSIANQSEQALIAAGIPVLAPSSIADILTLGLYGWAASRHAGLYLGFKTVEEIIDCTASIIADPDVPIVMPDSDPATVAMRLHEPILAQEARMFRIRHPALLEFVQANPINRIIDRAPGARIGIVTAGKSFLDVQQSRTDLALAGIRVLKLGMTWPLEPDIIRAFAHGLEEIIVVEEKQPLIETQIKTILYGTANAPRVLGKTDDQGRTLLKPESDLSAAEITLALGDRVQRIHPTEARATSLANLRANIDIAQKLDFGAHRTPHFCSGCPHSTSTVVPEGSRAMAGIGCHYMVTWMDRETDVFSQMGGEGVAWIGQAPFTTEQHVFANLGDGTYHHSGSLAIRAAIAAKANITYRILFNDAVAMTGGQHVDGPLSVPQITRQMHAEGAARIDIVTDEPEKYHGVTDLAPGVTIHHRRTLDALQRTLRETQGVTILIYDQTCATEKRRRRKRGTMVDPAKRAFINERVCEGCGDCSKTSNCVSVVPVETEFGRKRAIDQSSCNKDFSCVEGFCPSFVTVHDAGLKKPEITLAHAPENLPEPTLPSLDRPWNVVIAGIGGTGVVTIGALLGMAAHLDGNQVSVLDVLGLAQKGGAVVSHVRFGGAAGTGQSLRIPQGQADLLLGCDALVAAEHETLDCLGETTTAVVNLHETITGDFTRDPDFSLPMRRLRTTIAQRIGESNLATIEATKIATALMGDAIATNLFVLGYAWQAGKIPVARTSIEQAINLNNQAVALNLAAFAWGRAAALDLEAVTAKLPGRTSNAAPADLDSVIARFRDELIDYQNTAYAGRYMALLAEVRHAEQRIRPGSTALTEAVARNFYKLMAYKDEYEVARLYVAPAFRAAIAAQFEDGATIKFNLAPPLLAKRDKRTGHQQKREYGAWMLRVFGVLHHFKILRGTALDPFGHTAERRSERALIARYETSLRAVLPRLSQANFGRAVELAGLPAQIRGYGHIKARNLAAAEPLWASLDAAFTPTAPAQAPQPFGIAAE
ncbi:MAG: indolepyruvate ferredoxin oxidoreductase [Acidiphilium sp. 37-64-53]|uniref:indolepyruvate ferredoxin oxidoreductase family protein n=1 Tax=Acidiphilium TaxID=522 RepID=UPI000BD4DA96|nr:MULTISPECIES: indolepyruvate ferredoxin oxidoreductase family protein [Acidiphilium]OYW02822.1 MAG: indolepyruvate ferredoxin oxidoreductase [Acidiphilium sp. 37-64-53]OZB28941.1 MAG: indolepyruvate ferredoxin oxidoreductase [Acidiphilium sp. 34-64-41]HQT85272.1 indolepyruvate ferredoxin oxidoreductase family protein [Acidiphilium rubrum]